MSQGRLEVTLLGAHGLRDMQLIGKQDPYAVLQVGNLRFRTKVCVDGGKKPVWNENFQFDVPTGLSELQVMVWNDNTIATDDVIGSARVSLVKALQEKHDHARVPLKTNDGKPAGELEMFMDFTPVAKAGAVPAAQAAPQTAGSFPMAPPPHGNPPLYGQPQQPQYPPQAMQYQAQPQYGYPNAYQAQCGPPPMPGAPAPINLYVMAPGGPSPYPLQYGAPPPQYGYAPPPNGAPQYPPQYY